MQRDPITLLARLREMLRFDSHAGVFFWVNPNPEHSEKAGLVAGGLAKNRSRLGYWTIQIDGYRYLRSRLVFLWVHERWPNPSVDHINRNSLDDRPENLREATIAENVRNRRTIRRRINLPMGVRTTKTGRFQARINFNNKQLHLGCYDTPEQAQAAYQKKRKELFREFA